MLSEASLGNHMNKYLISRSTLGEANVTKSKTLSLVSCGGSQLGMLRNKGFLFDFL